MCLLCPQEQYFKVSGAGMPSWLHLQYLGSRKLKEPNQLVIDVNFFNGPSQMFLRIYIYLNYDSWVSVWGNFYNALCFINDIEMSQTVKACYCINTWKYLAYSLLELSATNKRYELPEPK